MEKQIILCKKEYKLRSSLYTIISYRQTFGSELFNDIKKVDSISKNNNQEDITAIVDTIFKITYILHKPFTDKTYDDFLNELDFSIISDVKGLEELAKTIATLIGSVTPTNKVTP